MYCINYKQVYLQQICNKETGSLFAKPLTYLFSLVLTAWAWQIHGQCALHLSGKVTEQNGKLPVAYVILELAETRMTCSTDSTGQYHFEPLCPGNYRLTCSRIGFITQQQTIMLSSDTIIDFNLVFEPGVFGTVEIIDRRPAENITSMSLVLGSEAIRKRSGESLATMLSALPGVSTLNTGSNISKPVIHGLHGNRILLLNNGIRQEGQQWGNEHAPEIDPFLADKLTVIHGAGSLRYGHDAIAGVVLIEPAELRATPGISTQVQLVGGSNGRSGAASGMIDLCLPRLPRVTVRAQGTLHRAGNIATPQIVLANTGKNEMNYSLAAIYRGNAWNAQIFYSQFNSQVGIFAGSHIGNLTDLERAISGAANQSGSPFSYEIGRPRQEMSHELMKVKFLRYFASINSKLTLTYARQYNLREEYDKHIPRSDSLAALNRPSLNLEITTHSGEAVWELRIRRQLKLYAGVTYMHQGNTTEGRFFIPNYIQQAAGSFASFMWQSGRTIFEGTIRYDVRRLDVYKYENDTLVTPTYQFDDYAISGGIHQIITPKWRLVANAGRSWRPPAASELYSNGLHHGAAAIEIGDKNLQEEISWSSNVHFIYEDRKNKVTISPYFNYIEDFINLTPQLPPTLTIRGAFPTFVYQQQDVQLYGLDITGQKTIAEQLTITASASSLRAVNMNTGNWLDQMPADHYRARIAYRFVTKRLIQNKKIEAGARYVNRQWRMNGANDYLRSPDAYALFDLSFSGTIPWNKVAIDISFDITNVFNTTYRDYLNRFRYFTDEQGRNFILRIHIPLQHNY
jgi:iron complex outermembrane recepter protein